MKNKFIQITSIFMVLLLFTGCGNSKEYSNQNNTETDLYVGEYVSVGELEGELKIEKSEGIYKIYIEFYDLTEIIATGEEENGTLIYDGIDKYGNEINGNIEEYGEAYPVRVEIYGDGLFDEIEFERK